MRRVLPFLTFIVIGSAAALSAPPARAEGNANFVLGQRSLDEGFWDPVDKQGVFGVTVDFGQPKWPINIAIGYYESEDKSSESFPPFGSVDFTGRVQELSAGVLKTWKIQKIIRPFVGGGLVHVKAKGEADVPGFGTDSDTDSSNGFYGEGGIYWRVGSRLNLGVSARLVRFTDVTLAGEDGDADYEQIGFLIGWGWPKSK